MDDLFMVNLAGGDEEGQARREAERRGLRDRYARHLVDTAGIDEQAAQRVMASLFDHMERDGGRCVCGCHPRLDSLHDGGFDCPCTWDDERRAREATRWSDLRDRPWAVELRKRHAEEEEAIARWVAGQPDVEARRLTWFAPEQWRGSVDGHSFYFRERDGMWRLELDLEPSGHFADRLIEVGEGGEMDTEPVPVM
ncbi:MAG: hypothetical protein M3245_03490, partial [Actinomycetota bacterium]|nr:hypothetical protein [Actinomycetota bacterium]